MYTNTPAHLLIILINSEAKLHSIYPSDKYNATIYGTRHVAVLQVNVTKQITFTSKTVLLIIGISKLNVTCHNIHNKQHIPLKVL